MFHQVVNQKVSPSKLLHTREDQAQRNTPGCIAAGRVSPVMITGISADAGQRYASPLRLRYSLRRASLSI